MMNKGKLRKRISRKGEMEGDQWGSHGHHHCHGITVAVTAGAGMKRQRQIRSSRGELIQLMMGDEQSDRNKRIPKKPRGFKPEDPRVPDYKFCCLLILFLIRSLQLFIICLC